jgi:hypothetical protein
MPAGQGKDAERFAAAVEQGIPPGAAGDAELARELEIVAMLRSRGAAYAPDADAKARAKQRLMAVLAAEQGGAHRAPAGPPVIAMDQTAPLGRLVEPGSTPTPRDGVDATAETRVIAPVTARQEPAKPADDEPTAAERSAEKEAAPAARPSRAGRRARHSSTARSVANRPAGRARASRRPSIRGRVAVVGTAALVMMLALAGGGIFASRDALPGDGLYAVKQAAESAGLALTFDDATRARRNLDIAATRLSEVQQLVDRQQGSADPAVYTAAMKAFDTATDEGSTELLSAAQSNGNPAAAEDLRTWVDEQSTRLTRLKPSLPAAAGADDSIELLDQLRSRTAALGAGPCSGDDCDPGRVNPTGPDHRGPDATEDGDATTTPPSTDEESESSTPTDDNESRDNSDSSDTDTPDPESSDENPQLLPDLIPDTERDGSSTRENDSDEDSSSNRESDAPDSDKGDDVDVPLPLLPPITLPPLLPGMPGLTIG